ncbi:proline dehydrogenase 1, mitochondrial [Corythoichthys intestinalis]|uniref:proline dehydrogenase 1, mitochondrial n=1 Tax=Corythoichthys intestinalis TaxID=161448 RepID=UPI0025A5EBA3|nr:proline dehydrogenase 1, mitochondrial [Corythoichthys intestinalis]
MLPAACVTRARAEAPLRRLLTSRRPRLSDSAKPAIRAQHTHVDVGGRHVDAEGHSAVSGRPSSGISVDFEQTREAYKSKDSLELLRSLVVLKMCSYDFLVDKNQEIMDFGKKVLGQKAFDQLMKMTFYGQFVAGEDHKAIRPLIQKNLAFGVGSVLDYSVEEDISQEEEPQTAMYSSESSAEKGEHNKDTLGGPQAYFYADESKCDQHMETFIKCIQASGGSSMDGFSAIKMTALGRPQFLLHLSAVLVKWRRFFNFLASRQGQDGIDDLEKKLDVLQIQEFLSSVGAKDDFYNVLTTQSDKDSGTIDLIGWESIFSDRANLGELLVVPNVQLGELEPLLKDFTEEDEGQMKRILQRMDVLAKHAVKNGVRLMVDAEQTYMQPAISRLTLEMQKVYNKDKPVIFNTYQCYLKDAFDNITLAVELSRREGWHFAAKLVRGAYMHQERERALEFDYEDPINPDYESTNEMYHRCLDFVLDEIALNKNANVMVASHNEDTVKHTLRRMNELGLLPRENKVFFGQLLGMCDQISFPLGQAGFPVYKYVPYGPVNEVMPYLSRRAQENRGFMKGAQKERALLWKELKRRLTSRELLYRPLY